MKKKLIRESYNFYEDYPELLICENSIEKAITFMIDSFKNSGKLLVCGNGGSACDSNHIAAELTKGFLIRRKLPANIKSKIDELSTEKFKHLSEILQPGLPVISLTGQTSIITSILNDLDPCSIFAQQIICYGKQNDILLMLSTSGRSHNIIAATIVAKAIGMKTVLMTGSNKSEAYDLVDIVISVPSTETFKIQEYHLPIYHYICRAIEMYFYG